MPIEDILLPELRRMNRLLALVATRGVETADAVVMLTKAGYTQSEAGAILGLTKNAVALTLFRKRRSAGRKPTMADGDAE